MTDQRDPTGPIAFLGHVRSHMLPDFFVWQGRRFQSGKKIRAKQLKMFPVDGAEFRFRHFTSKRQPQISKRKSATISKNEISEVTSYPADDERRVERHQPHHCNRDTKDEIRTEMKKSD